MEISAMVFLLAALVLLLVGGFFFMWKKDKDHADVVSDNPERLHTDPKQQH